MICWTFEAGQIKQRLSSKLTTSLAELYHCGQKGCTGENKVMVSIKRPLNRGCSISGYI